jgi:hypothetical protein
LIASGIGCANPMKRAQGCSAPLGFRDNANPPWLHHVLSYRDARSRLQLFNYEKLGERCSEMSVFPPHPDPLPATFGFWGEREGKLRYVVSRGSALFFSPSSAGRSHPLPWLAKKVSRASVGQYRPNYGSVGNTHVTPSPLVGEGWGEG